MFLFSNLFAKSVKQQEHVPVVERKEPAPTVDPIAEGIKRPFDHEFYKYLCANPSFLTKKHIEDQSIFEMLLEKTRGNTDTHLWISEQSKTGIPPKEAEQAYFLSGGNYLMGLCKGNDLLRERIVSQEKDLKKREVLEAFRIERIKSIRKSMDYVPDTRCTI